MFADKLKELRNKEGISQAALGKALNMSQQGIAKWETGSTSPNPEMLRKIAQYFNVSIDELLDNDIKKSSGEKPEDIAEDEDDDIVLFNREARKMTPEQRKKLLEMAKVMFGEAYNDESHK